MFTQRSLRIALPIRKIGSSLLRLGAVLVLAAMLVFPGAKPAHAISAPSLLFPGNGITISATGHNGSLAQPPVAIPEFCWQDVTGAISYKIEISLNIGFSAPNLHSVVTKNTCYTPPYMPNFVDGDWYWRVKVENPSSLTYSEVRTFVRRWGTPDNIPLVTGPQDSAVLSFFDPPTFSWEPVIGAARYTLEISRTYANFDNNIVVTYSPRGNTFQPTSRLANGTYYWRVRAIDQNYTQGMASPIREFTQVYNYVPDLLEPANNATPTFTPTFRWTAVRGAREYVLQYSTSNIFPIGTVEVTTKNTSFTPLDVLDNNVDYYWRVKARSAGSTESVWSQVRKFRKRWYIPARLLTPTNLFQNVKFPYFSWTPVPGAAHYIVQIDQGNADFNGLYIQDTTSNTYYVPEIYNGTFNTFYWRVIPVDAGGKQSVPSEVFSYVSSFTSQTPVQIYPLYYYEPNNFPSPDDEVVMNPAEDRTAPYPLFMWNRLFDYAGNIVGGAYRVDVKPDREFLQPSVWTQDTENLAATPDTDNPFTPNPGSDYYWRVCPLDHLGGTILSTNYCSQVWRARFDPDKGLEDRADQVPALLRPTYHAEYNPTIDPGYDAAEFIETTPRFEWFPVEGASQYQIEISRSSAFDADQVDLAEVNDPVYSPALSFAQRSLGEMEYGTFYWRVQAYVDGEWQGWSDTWRFHIASQSVYRLTRTTGNAANRLQIASDPASDSTPAYELNRLYASQASEYWYFGFDYTASGDATYVLYLDRDRRENLGAHTDKDGYQVSTIPAHRPDYAIYIPKTAGALSSNTIRVYEWDGESWFFQGLLNTISGELFTGAGYAEIRVPNTAIGMEPEFGSYSLSLFSVNGSGVLCDSVPSDPAVNCSDPAELSRFSSVSEHVTLSFPPSTVTGDPTTFPSVPALFFDNPVGPLWAGAKIEIYRDAQFTSQKTTADIVSNAPYYSSSDFGWDKDLSGDDTYYWRIQPRYMSPEVTYGSWSQGWSFRREGFVPANMQESVTFATPTFSWDMVEGADRYRLEIATDDQFLHRIDTPTTALNSYTPPRALDNGIYYWRLKVVRWGGIESEWGPAKMFLLDLPTPTGLTPHDPDKNQVVRKTPTLCWTPVISYSQGIPVFAAHKYRIQIFLTLGYCLVNSAGGL